MTEEEFKANLAQDVANRQQPLENMDMYSATEMLRAAANHMSDRAASRDTPKERSMANCVKAFNTIYDKDLTETEGWQFMSILKKVRGAQGKFRLDDYEDDIAYAALAAESAVKE